jgi:hypothetical protein
MQTVIFGARYRFSVTAMSAAPDPENHSALQVMACGYPPGPPQSMNQERIGAGAIGIRPAAARVARCGADGHRIRNVLRSFDRRLRSLRQPSSLPDGASVTFDKSMLCPGRQKWALDHAGKAVARDLTAASLLVRRCRNNIGKRVDGLRLQRYEHIVTASYKQTMPWAHPSLSQKVADKCFLKGRARFPNAVKVLTIYCEL